MDTQSLGSVESDLVCTGCGAVIPYGLHGLQVFAIELFTPMPATAKGRPLPYDPLGEEMVFHGPDCLTLWFVQQPRIQDALGDWIASRRQYICNIGGVLVPLSRTAVEEVMESSPLVFATNNVLDADGVMRVLSEQEVDWVDSLQRPPRGVKH